MKRFVKIFLMVSVLAAAVLSTASCLKKNKLQVVYSADMISMGGEVSEDSKAITTLFYTSLGIQGSPFIVYAESIEESDFLIKKACETAEEEVVKYLKEHPEFTGAFVFSVKNTTTKKEIYNFVKADI